MCISDLQDIDSVSVEYQPQVQTFKGEFQYQTFFELMCSLLNIPKICF